jgi:hypothetical protein
MVLSNVQEMVTCEYIAHDLAAIALGKQYALPESPGERVNVASSALRRLQGIYRPKRILGPQDMGTIGDDNVTIRARGSNLVMSGLAFVAPPFAQKTTLRPFSPELFFNPQDPHVRISFKPGSDGMKLIVHLPPYKRLPAMKEVYVRDDAA